LIRQTRPVEVCISRPKWGRIKSVSVRDRIRTQGHLELTLLEAEVDEGVALTVEEGELAADSADATEVDVATLLLEEEEAWDDDDDEVEVASVGTAEELDSASIVELATLLVSVA
jgi:hypothetical protein